MKQVKMWMFLSKLAGYRLKGLVGILLLVLKQAELILLSAYDLSAVKGAMRTFHVALIAVRQ